MSISRVIGLLGVLCMVAGALAQTTTARSSTPEQQVGALVDRGFQALQAGQPTAAIEQLADARALALKNQLNTNPATKQAEYGLGVAYMMVGRYDRSRGYVDRSLIKPTTRDQIYNLGAFDLRTRKDVVRSLKFLADYLNAHDDADEPMVSLFGACLDRAVEDHVSIDQKRMEEFSNLYLKRKKKVEETQSGKVLWGANWLTKEEQARIERFNLKVDGEIKVINASLDAAQNRYNRAAQQQRQELLRTHSIMSSESNEMRSAREDMEKYQGQIRDLAAQTIRPDFPKLMPAMIPPWNDMPARLAGDIPVVEIAGVAALDRAELKKPSEEQGIFRDMEPLPTRSTTKPTTPLAGKDGKNGTGTTKLPVKTDRDIELNPPTVKAPKQAITIQRTAAAVPVGADLLLTSITVAKDAQHVTIDSDTMNREVTVERIDAANGLALLRVKGANYPYFNLASRFDGGAVQAMGYPSVSIFLPEVQTINGTAPAIGAGDWRVSLQIHPRLLCTPVLNANRELVGVTIATRDDDKGVLPTISCKTLATVLAGLNIAPCANAQAASVQQVTSEIKVGGE